jgi:hypothetical protein
MRSDVCFGDVKVVLARRIVLLIVQETITKSFVHNVLFVIRL